MAEHRDRSAVVVLAAAAAALLAALALLILPALRAEIQSPLAQYAAGEAASPDISRGLAVGALLLLSLVFALLGRWRMRNNRALWRSAGCPQCQEPSLVRVRRTAGDRVLALSVLPIGRFRCPECFWNGLRLRIETAPSGAQAAQNQTAHDTAVRKRPYGAGSRAALPENDIEIEGVRSGPVPAQMADSEAAPAIHPGLDLSPAIRAAHVTSRTGELPDAADSVRLRQIDTVTLSTINNLPGPALMDRPAASGRKLLDLEPGKIVMVLNAAEEERERSWQWVVVNDQKGWLMAKYLDS